MAGNQANSTVRGWIKKRGTLQTDRKAHILGRDVPSGKSKKGGKERRSLMSNVTCCSLCPHYNKISHADQKYPSCTGTMTLLIELNKDKNPSSLREGGAGMKIMEYDSQTPPSQ